MTQAFKGYTLARGFYWPDATPPAVIEAIANAHASGARVRIFGGDAATGEAWAEEFDIMGTIGRSTGPRKVALLMPRASSRGGGAIMPQHIVAIQSGPGRFLYRHPNFSAGDWQPCAPRDSGYVEAVTHNGQLHAQFSRPCAANYCAFMRGERWRF